MTGPADQAGLRLFGVAHTVAAAALITAYLVDGVHGLTVAVLLGVLEVAVSFDNAIVNAAVLARLDVFWQKIFLTVGILIAAIGMRLLVPLAVVSIGTGLDPVSALHLAYSDPARYHRTLLSAQPVISAFGGTFLLMIFFGFVFTDHDQHWIGPIERPLERLGRIPHAGEALVLAFTTIAAATTPPAVAWKVATGMLTGLAAFLLIGRAGLLLAAQTEGGDDGRATLTGRAAFFGFCYLELLDATFSFDSVMGAFSVTLDIALITIGLAIGAAYIRALTVFLVRSGTLEQFRYLEHGAYYAIGTLAVLLLAQVWRDVPDVLTAGASATLILAAMLSSRTARD